MNLLNAANIHSLIGNLIPYSFDPEEISDKIKSSRNEIIVALYAIFTQNKIKFQLKKVKALAKRYCITDLKSNKDFWWMESCIVVLLNNQKESEELRIPLEAFLTQFPEFRTLPPDEMHRLYDFRNLFVIGMQYCHK